MSFMAIMDWVSSIGADADSYLPLRVKKDVDVSPNMEITVTPLNKNNDNDRFNHFFNPGYAGITAKIEILLKATDLWNNEPVISILRLWHKNMTPLAVVTDAVDVPDGQYIITKTPSRKQNYKGSTIWELELTTYTPLILAKFKNDNTNVLNALKKNKAKQKASKNKKNALSKCKYNVLKYSKKKKVVKCVKTLQTILKKKKYYTGKIDGWYGKDTLKAVRKFQKKYNKKYGKPVTTNAMNGLVVPKTNIAPKVSDPYNLLAGVTLGKVSTSSKTGTAKVSLTKLLPTNGKIDKETYKQLIKL